ncbi:hypothetical protein NIES4072_48510 [Nostoc commune NIES-4072]|uniref:KAP NTPase domain-containing protein n=1 Tax=Nostoc commune NIES-4072 TaxID=2005467 RepID=A0A2R5FUN3_NOSCO|nr:P-loop NTPase fold protein [Nostoc commune]BBD67848.1 hypothetical protein NIES4070_42420 [Nostoc commune HK-02]GBG21168.1 hypothetical protein NIES4072_48510 [Nostoc commune NIES-4072]
MSNNNFWRTAYQLFKPEEPLATPEGLKSFYVQRDNSPVDKLISLLEMEDDPAKFLLAGHRGGGKTTELRRLEQKLADKYAVVWIDTQTSLDRYNIGHAEVVVLIGLQIARQVIQSNWLFKKDKLLQALLESLKSVVYLEKGSQTESLGMPEFIEKAGIILKRGLTTEVTKTLNVRPLLSEIITIVNNIIEAAEKEQKQKLLIIVDGLDRHDQITALEMFSSSLLIELNCHIIYSIPISLRYSPSFRQPMETFQKCLDLNNPPVFDCDDNLRPTHNPNHKGREILINVINKRIISLGDSHKGLFNPDALELICKKSGGVMRDLVRLARTTCEIGLRNKLTLITLKTAEEAVREVRKEYNLNDYHYPELDLIHRTGKLTTKAHSLPSKGEFIICDELLQNKLVLGYYNSMQESWFDINPILIEDLERWQTANNHI